MGKPSKAIAASLIALAFGSSAAFASDVGEKAVIGYHMANAKAQLSAGETLESDTRATVRGSATVKASGKFALEVGVQTETAAGAAYNVVAKLSGKAGETISTIVLVNGEARPADVLVARADGCSGAVCPAAARISIQLADGHSLDLSLPAEANR